MASPSSNQLSIRSFAISRKRGKNTIPAGSQSAKRTGRSSEKIPAGSFGTELRRRVASPSCSGGSAILRPAHELHRLRPGRQRRDAVRLQGLLELAPLRVGKRRLACLLDRLDPGAIVRQGVALDERVEDPQEIALAALVRLAVALDQPAAQRYFERQARVPLRRRSDRGQPAADQRLLFVPARGVTPERT